MKSKHLDLLSIVINKKNTFATIFYNFITSMNLFSKLKNKWKVGWFQFILIFTTFALGGSLCAKLGNLIIGNFLTEKNFLFWIIYVPVVTILWPICVLLVSLPFGQFSFFVQYLRKIGTKIGLNKEA